MEAVLADPAVLAGCLADEDFGFSLRGWPGEGGEFFRGSADGHDVLAERRRWLIEDPSRYVAADESPAAGAVVDELRRMLAASGLVDPWNPGPGDACPGSGGSVRERCLALGGDLEPDFVILQSAPAGDRGRGATDGAIVLAGVVAFPSHWDFPSTLGLPVRRIHAVVPGLNEAIGEKIDQFLGRLGPGRAWYRINWGISASPEPNQHPSRSVRRVGDLVPPFSSADLWFRVELQVLWRLPESGGIVFGIRPFSIAFDRLRGGPWAPALRRQIATLPDAMCRYKGLGSADRACAIAKALD